MAIGRGNSIWGENHDRRLATPAGEQRTDDRYRGAVMSIDHSQRFEDLAERLRSISEELTELGIDALREAVDEGATSRPPVEKPIAAARRAVEKAIRVLDDAR